MTTHVTQQVTTCLNCRVSSSTGAVIMCPLHAAAPDLLASLQAIVDHVGYCGVFKGTHVCSHSPHPFSEAREIIRKATRQGAER